MNSYIHDNSYSNYIHQLADARRVETAREIQFENNRRDADQYLQMLNDRYDRYDRMENTMYPDPYRSPPIEVTYPSVGRLMSALCGFCSPFGFGLMTGSGTILSFASQVESDLATKCYIAGGVGMMSGLMLVLCRGVGNLNRDNSNRSSIMDCVVRFASILTSVESCTCYMDEQLPY